MTRIQITMLSLSLGLLLLFVGAVVADLKSPHIQTQTCQWVGRGRALGSFRHSARVLYQQSQNPEADLGMMCPDLGPVMVNDVNPMVVDPSVPVSLTLKTYRWLPPRTHLSVALLK